ncbi:MAG TPA: LuxR C-terminal-related transcriptional regulator [Rhodocyclaceae bacterium]|nr:LuxR C-terminal-related transcriptional regulator [Rhodocyclaceae bacterium]
MSTAGSIRTSAYIRHLCSLGVPDATVIPEIVEALRQLVAADSGIFYWAGEDFDISAVYAQKEEVYKTYPAYCELRANGQINQVPGDFTDWMRRRRCFANSARVDRDFVNSAFYFEIVRPSRCRHVVVSLIEDGIRGWGALILTRELGRSPFSETELAAIESFKAHIMHALRHPQHAVSEYLDDADAAVILADWYGRMLHCSPSAIRLMRFAQNSTLDGDASPQRLPEMLMPLLGRLQRLSKGEPTAEARIETINQWGRFTWRGYPLDASAGITASPGFILHVQHQQPRLLTSARGAHELGLSAQQQVVSVRWASGETQRDIARELGVKESTVVDHVRRVYERLDVRDCAALATRLTQAGASSLSL